ncbi:MAG: HlyD family secretion protein [Acetobacteraceae bacterium]|nr:HlyD family secretion protein [Acetobacteraceae bacterium]
MADSDLRAGDAAEPLAARVAHDPRPGGDVAPTTRLRALPVLVTLVALGLAGLLAWAMWQAYMAAPWTRDGTVRAYVVTIAPEVAGRIAQLPVVANQFVHKGDLLVGIDPTDYAIAVEQAQAAADQARANQENAQREAERRAQLSGIAASQEEKQTYATSAVAARASYLQALASLAHARVNLDRTTIRSPVNGYVTNLLVQLGDYANVGQNVISVVNSDSFWVDGYFEETSLEEIHEGDPATIRLMGYRPLLHGHVDSVAHGIAVANAEPGQFGLASVNPIFTWVRLAQRVPVRIHIDEIPAGVRLVAGETASIQITPRPGRR